MLLPAPLLSLTPITPITAAPRPACSPAQRISALAHKRPQAPLLARALTHALARSHTLARARSLAGSFSSSVFSDARPSRIPHPDSATRANTRAGAQTRARARAGAVPCGRQLRPAAHAAPVRRPRAPLLTAAGLTRNSTGAEGARASRTRRDSDGTVAEHSTKEIKMLNQQIMIHTMTLSNPNLLNLIKQNLSVCLQKPRCAAQALVATGRAGL